MTLLIPSLPAATRRRYVWSLAITICTAFGAVFYGFSVLLTERAAAADFSATVLSAGYAGGILVSGAVSVPVGRWADRHGIRGIIATGGLLVGTGMLVFAAASRPWQVLAAWLVLIGPGTAMVLFEPAFIAFQQWFDVRDRNAAAGTLTLLTGLAGPIFIPSTYRLVDAAGWRPTAAGLGGLVATLALLTAWWALRDAPRPVRPGADGSDGVRRHPLVGQYLRAPRFIGVTVALALVFGAMDAMQVHRLARFEEAGFPVGTLAFWAAVASVLSLPARFVLPRLATRFNPTTVLTVLVTALVPAYALAVTPAADWHMIGHFVLFGALFGATVPMRTVVMGNWYAGPTFGALMGVQALAIALGRSAGPGAAGWLRGLTGDYVVSMTVLLAAVVSATVLIIVCRRWRRVR